MSASWDAPEVAAADRLAILLDQERRLQFSSFDHLDAWRLGELLREVGLQRGLPIAISVLVGDQLVYHAGLPGASADNDEWVQRKFRVVHRFGHSSLAVRLSYEAGGKDFDTDSRLDRTLYAPFGGAFPLLVQGNLVGIVGVSGLPQLEDHRLVLEAISSHPRLSRPTERPGGSAARSG